MEDNPGDVGLIREALEANSIECELAVIADGETAIQFIQGLEADHERCPDLVILDLNLPRRSGWEVLQIMRAGAGCGRMPIMILTSSDNEKDRSQATRLGASEYVRKPTRLADFMKVGGAIGQILKRKLS